MIRRDIRGRRIGRNPWRDLITEHWRLADHAWFLKAEAVCIGYATELAEYRAENPRPNLGDFMRELAPMWTGPLGQQYAADAA